MDTTHTWPVIRKIRNASQMRDVLSMDEGRALACPVFQNQEHIHERIQDATGIIIDFDNLLTDPNDLEEALKILTDQQTMEYTKPTPIDPFARQSSDWWSDRSVRSGHHLSEDRKMISMAQKLARAGVDKGKLRTIGTMLPKPNPDTHALLKTAKYPCVYSYAPTDVVESYLYTHGVAAIVIAPQMREGPNGLEYREETIPAGQRLNEAIRRFMKENSLSAPELMIVTSRCENLNFLRPETTNVVVLSKRDQEEIQIQPTRNPLTSGFTHVTLITADVGCDYLVHVRA